MLQVRFYSNKEVDFLDSLTGGSLIFIMLGLEANNQLFFPLKIIPNSE